MFDDFLFEMLYLPKMEQYNAGLTEQLPELSQVADPHKRFAQSAAIMGDTFAEICGHPGDKQYSLIGVGAIGLLHISTERLFRSRLR